jgi:type II secretory pathway component PulF
MSAVIAGSTYPLVLLGMVAMLLHQIATNMVPQFEKILPPEKWTGPAVGLKVVADWVNGYGSFGMIFFTCFAAWVIWSMPNMNKSRLRVYLDRIPPWSIYRMLNGSTFLLNFSLMLASNVKMQRTLEIMKNNASPWLKERIGAAIAGVNKGHSFGEALHRSGYEFPDRRAVQFLRLLSEQEDFDKKLVSFGQRWLTKSVKGVQYASKALLSICIALMGFLIMLILGGVIGIQQLAQTALSTH